ncbi:hypothetical protein LOD99_2718 [Oopsacas minuta]|uniref:Uncharacterized protein n=1 Tax=Oopsacas minuta TaxID=111878 RepID=A0AAV7K0S9_9METZ|nr:hypothetical protein LOD99_2718 [Oopsacas minuta]
MGFALRKLKNTNRLKQPSKALEYAQKERRVSKPYLHVKDRNFISRLREIKLTEIPEVQDTIEQRYSPPPRSKSKDARSIPIGMLDTDQITLILANKRKYPETWNKAYVSNQFQIKEEHAEGLITSFNNYVEPPAKRLKEPGNTESRPVVDN